MAQGVRHGREGRVGIRGVKAVVRTPEVRRQLSILVAPAGHERRHALAQSAHRAVEARGDDNRRAADDALALKPRDVVEARDGAADESLQPFDEFAVALALVVEENDPKSALAE